MTFYSPDVLPVMTGKTTLKIVRHEQAAGVKHKNVDAPLNDNFNQRLKNGKNNAGIYPC